jgi:DNA gyrase subunit A
MDIGTVRPVDINEEMRDSYLDYAMSVIVARALPDARDGLKPVHRRILYAMHDMGIRSARPMKSAQSARYWAPSHGDGSLHAMAHGPALLHALSPGRRAGQPSSIGSDGRQRALHRGVSPQWLLMLEDIEKNTIGFIDNFDGSLQEPEILPGKLPNLLVNGVAGIAVGMATNIPPHNLREITAAVDYLIERMTAPAGEAIDEELADVRPEELMKYVQGPDFPTGGSICGMEGIVSAYATGRGRVIVRAKMDVEAMPDGERFRIVVTEIPYQINKTTIIERIAQLVREGRLDMIADLRDESDRNGMGIVIELKRGAQPKTVINRLLKFTPLQTTFGVQMLALVNGEPRLLSLKGALRHYINHRREVIERRTQFELERARRRAHVLEGLLIAIANLDAVIQTIRASNDADDARTRLMSGFNLTEAQAQAILDMQLRRLAALERHNIEEEYQRLLGFIAECEDLLAHPKKILNLIREDLNALAEKHGDDRRTAILPDELDALNEEDLITEEDVLIFITREGYIKRVPVQAYRAQNRRGKGVIGITTKETDDVQHLFSAGTLDSILFFSNKGKVYHQKLTRFSRGPLWQGNASPHVPAPGDG